MPRRRSRAREFQIYMVPLVGSLPAAGVGGLLVWSPLGPPEGTSPPATAVAVGAAIIVVVLCATGLLLWAPQAWLRLRVGVLILVAGLFGAAAVLTSTLTAAGTLAWLMPLLWLHLALAVVLAGVASTITSPDNSPPTTNTPHDPSAPVDRAARGQPSRTANSPAWHGGTRN